VLDGGWLKGPRGEYLNMMGRATEGTFVGLGGHLFTIVKGWGGVGERKTIEGTTDYWGTLYAESPEAKKTQEEVWKYRRGGVSRPAVGEDDCNIVDAEKKVAEDMQY